MTTPTPDGPPPEVEEFAELGTLVAGPDWRVPLVVSAVAAVLSVVAIVLALVAM